MEKKNEEKMPEEVLNQEVSNDELKEVNGGIGKICIGNAHIFHASKDMPDIKDEDDSSN